MIRLIGFLAMVVMLALPAATAAADELADALAAFNGKDYARAASLLAPLARGGNATAQVRMGLLYYHGHAVRENDQRAFEWFLRAAEQGNAEGQFHLANMYMYGLGVPATESEPDRVAALWYFEAARRGHAEAQYNLGILFLAGKGVYKNEDEALKWIRRSAERNYEPARRFLGQYGGNVPR
jgi:hypothetical protein